MFGWDDPWRPFPIFWDSKKWPIQVLLIQHEVVVHEMLNLFVHTFKWYTPVMSYIHSQKNKYRNLLLPLANVWIHQEGMWYLFSSWMCTCYTWYTWMCIILPGNWGINLMGQGMTSSSWDRRSGKIPLLEDESTYWNWNTVLGRNRFQSERN